MRLLFKLPNPVSGLKSCLFGVLPVFPDIQVKELEKRASGQAFELILSPRSKEAVPEFPLSPPKKKDVSLEEIQKKLEAAEERRKVNSKQLKLRSAVLGKLC